MRSLLRSGPEDTEPPPLRPARLRNKPVNRTLQWSQTREDLRCLLVGDPELVLYCLTSVLAALPAESMAEPPDLGGPPQEAIKGPSARMEKAAGGVAKAAPTSSSLREQEATTASISSEARFTEGLTSAPTLLAERRASVDALSKECFSRSTGCEINNFPGGKVEVEPGTPAEGVIQDKAPGGVLGEAMSLIAPVRGAKSPKSEHHGQGSSAHQKKAADDGVLKPLSSEERPLAGEQEGEKCLEEVVGAAILLAEDKVCSPWERSDHSETVASTLTSSRSEVVRREVLVCKFRDVPFPAESDYSEAAKQSGVTSAAGLKIDRQQNALPAESIPSSAAGSKKYKQQNALPAEGISGVKVENGSYARGVGSDWEELQRALAMQADSMDSDSEDSEEQKTTRTTIPVPAVDSTGSDSDDSEEQKTARAVMSVPTASFEQRGSALFCDVEVLQAAYNQAQNQVGQGGCPARVVKVLLTINGQCTFLPQQGTWCVVETAPVVELSLKQKHRSCHLVTNVERHIFKFAQQTEVGPVEFSLRSGVGKLEGDVVAITRFYPLFNGGRLSRWPDRLPSEACQVQDTEFRELVRKSEEESLARFCLAKFFRNLQPIESSKELSCIRRVRQCLQGEEVVMQTFWDLERRRAWNRKVHSGWCKLKAVVRAWVAWVFRRKAANDVRATLARPGRSQGSRGVEMSKSHIARVIKDLKRRIPVVMSRKTLLTLNVEQWQGWLVRFHAQWASWAARPIEELLIVHRAWHRSAHPRGETWIDPAAERRLREWWQYKGVPMGEIRMWFRAQQRNLETGAQRRRTQREVFPRTQPPAASSLRMNNGLVLQIHARTVESLRRHPANEAVTLGAFCFDEGIALRSFNEVVTALLEARESEQDSHLAMSIKRASLRQVMDFVDSVVQNGGWLCSKRENLE